MHQLAEEAALVGKFIDGHGNGVTEAGEPDFAEEVDWDACLATLTPGADGQLVFEGGLDELKVVVLVEE